MIVRYVKFRFTTCRIQNVLFRLEFSQRFLENFSKNIIIFKFLTVLNVGKYLRDILVHQFRIFLSNFEKREGSNL